MTSALRTHFNISRREFHAVSLYFIFFFGTPLPPPGADVICGWIFKCLLYFFRTGKPITLEWKSDDIPSGYVVVENSDWSLTLPHVWGNLGKRHMDCCSMIFPIYKNVILTQKTIKRHRAAPGHCPLCFLSRFLPSLFLLLSFSRSYLVLRSLAPATSKDRSTPLL